MSRSIRRTRSVLPPSFPGPAARAAWMRWLLGGVLCSALVVAGAATIVIYRNADVQKRAQGLYRDGLEETQRRQHQKAVKFSGIPYINPFGWLVSDIDAEAARARPLAAATGSTAELAAFIPDAAFRGNQAVLIGSALETAAGKGDSVLVRGNSACSLSQHGYPDLTSTDNTGTVTLTGLEAAFRKLAGLPAAAATYPKGCTDRSIGLPSADGAYLGSTANGDALVAVADELGKITATRIGAGGAVVGTQVLAVGAVPPFYDSAAYTFAAADFNGDGLADIVSPMWTAGDGRAGVAVFLSQTSGTYLAPAQVFGYGSAVTGYQARAAIEDVDGDGKLDLIAMDGSTSTGIGTLMTLRGDGRGGFSAGPSSSLPSGAYGLPFAIADFNGDGRKDIVTAGGYFMPGQAGGGFGAAVKALAGSMGYNLETLALGDFNGDGHLDAALLNGLGYVNSRFVSIYLGGGDGSFGVGPAYATVSGARGLAVTDIDGDGIADLWVGRADVGVYTSGHKTGTLMHALLGKGDGSFAGAPARATSPLAYMPFTVADFDGDGKLDLASLGISPMGDLHASSQLLLSAGSAGGDFGASALAADLSFTPRFAVGGDFNGDGRPDVAVAGGSVSVLLGQIGGGFGAEQPSTAAPGTSIETLAVGDVTGDGRSDVVIVTTTGVYVQYANAEGSLQAPLLVDDATDGRHVAVADLNADGRADIVLERLDPNTPEPPPTPLRIHVSKAGGGFAAPLLLAPPTGLRYGALAIADMNKDGKPDLVVTTSSNTVSQVSVLPGKGDGGFGAAEVLALQADSTIAALTVADFTFDGNPDVMVLRESDLTTVLHGDGSSKLIGETGLAIAGGSTHAMAADLNGDTVTDAVLATGLTGIVTLHRTRQAIDAAAPPPPPPPITMAASSLAGSVASGASVSTNLSFGFATGFAETVTLSCSGLPANATCSFAPSSLVAGSGSVASVLTIQTGTEAAAAPFGIAGFGPGSNPTALAALLALALAAVVASRFGGLRTGSPSLRRALQWSTLLAAGWVAGCGGEDAPAPATVPPLSTPAGTYDIVITAGSPSASQTLTYVLTVK